MFKENNRIIMRSISKSSKSLMKKQLVTSRSISSSLLSSLSTVQQHMPENINHTKKTIKKAVSKSLTRGNQDDKTVKTGTYDLMTNEMTKELCFVEEDNKKTKVIFHFTIDSKWTIEIIENYRHPHYNRIVPKSKRLADSLLNASIATSRSFPVDKVKIIKKAVKKGLKSQLQPRRESEKTKRLRESSSDLTINDDLLSNDVDTAVKTDHNNIDSTQCDLEDSKPVIIRIKAELENSTLNSTEEENQLSPCTTTLTTKDDSVNQNEDDINWIISENDSNVLKSKEEGSLFGCFFNLFQQHSNNYV